MVNLATYIGSSQAGFLGAVLATLAVVIPSFIVLLLVMEILKTFLKNRYVQAVLQGLKPCIIGIILATGIYMLISNCFTVRSGGAAVNVQSAVIAVILLAILVGSKKINEKNLTHHPDFIVSPFGNHRLRCINEKRF